MTAKKQPTMKFAVSVCSVCEKVVLCLGDQRHGGIRYCINCLTHTLGWFQMSADGQEKIRTAFAEAESSPRIKKQHKQSSSISDELAHSVAVGEARRRAWMADIEESRKP